MAHDAGIDGSWNSRALCVVDGTGRIVRAAKLASEPEALITWFASLGLRLARVGLEAGPRSQWLDARLRAAGLPAELLETRHVHAAFKVMPVKTDRKDARGSAQLMIDGTGQRGWGAVGPIARLLPAGVLQVARGTAGAGIAHGTQARAIQAP
jgi:transposase